MNEPIETLQHTEDIATHLAILYGPRVVSAALILIAGIFITKWMARLTLRGLHRFALEPPVTQLILRVVRLLVFALFLVLALQNLGIELLPLIAGLGIAGAAVALALQGVLGNAAAGLTIIFTRPFRVGEYISIAGEEGEVRDISLFSTTLRHSDLSRVVIPNRKIAGEILHNFGEIRQLNVRVSLAYGAELSVALDAIGQVLRENARVLRDPAPSVQTALLGELSITIAVMPWVAVRDYGSAIDEINAAILREFRRRSLSLQAPVSLPDHARSTRHA
jgi:small conductance mechanosensitive channel